VDNQISVARDRIVGENGRVRILNDLGDRFELHQDFLEKVIEDGFTPQIFGNGQMCHVYADPVRERVYYFHRGCFGFEKLARLEPETGKCELLDVWGDDLAFGPDGLMYVRRVGHIIRLNPDTLEPVYFDYGEDVRPTTTWHKKLQKGAIRLEDQKGAKTFQDGIGVGIDGTICVLSNIFSATESWGPAYATRPWKYHGLKVKLKAGWQPYTVRRFPGRLTWGNATVWLFSNKGELLREDHIPGLSIGSCGIRRDKDGNLYIGYNHHKVVAGRTFIDGALVKFPPEGGRILTTKAVNPPLAKIPAREPDFSTARAGTPIAEAKDKQWAEGMLWSYAGMGDFSIPDGYEGCTCPNNRFDLDYFGRAFIPECYRHSVGVVDSNGNLACHIGQYGNEDSRGPDSPIPVGGDGIPLGWPWYVSVTDRHLYVSDSLNDRIVVVKLDYHTTVELAVPAR
jgi:hypothetical protein